MFCVHTPAKAKRKKKNRKKKKKKKDYTQRMLTEKEGLLYHFFAVEGELIVEVMCQGGHRKS